MLCNKIREVDITEVLSLLPGVDFVDTGGTNGWIASPEWLMPFVDSLSVGKISSAVCRLLPPFQGIPAHIDSGNNSFNVGRRFHVPLVTHPDVTMVWPNEGITEHLEAGYLYEVDHRTLHEVVNRAPTRRVHIQFNVV